MKLPIKVMHPEHFQNQRTERGNSNPWSAQVQTDEQRHGGQLYAGQEATNMTNMVIHIVTSTSTTASSPGKHDSLETFRQRHVKSVNNENHANTSQER